MEEDARISQLSQRACTHILQPAFSLRNHFSPNLCNLCIPWHRHGNGQREDWTPVHEVCKWDTGSFWELLGWGYWEYWDSWDGNTVNTVMELLRANMLLHPPQRGFFEFSLPLPRRIDYSLLPGKEMLPFGAQPCDKGLLEGCARLAMAGGCARLSRRGSPCPPRAPERSDLRGASTPRQLGRLQNPHDVCWELLQHARRSHPSLSPAPRTTGPASSGAGAARTPCPPRGSGRGSCRCSGLPRAHPAGRGCIPPAGLSPHPGPCPFCCRSLKNYLMCNCPVCAAHPWRAGAG